MTDSYLYLKAIHIIFVVTWFAGLFYMPRLLIYNVEANEKPQEIKEALQSQFRLMMKRLWYGITWPSAIITLIFGLTILIKGGWWAMVFEPQGRWLLIKLILVILLYGYHLHTQKIFRQQLKGVFRYSSQQLRLWNEVATLFLISIVMLVVVKQSMSLLWGLVGIALLILLLMLAIRIYKSIRTKNLNQKD
ncbi:MAG TPA: CopD family protein [Niabella sp.]|nr:CopD family protein [Niabella sp.]HOZ98033.1 CopD family protein [Niabella sp.]HQW14822.1 CopD family protein [Niabella sp.]HQX18553.1 CopD family protein [Niabella sp.]HQX40773.1 CopD family protein [Niabella sp.]